MCFNFFVQILSQKFLILGRIERDIIINIHKVSANYCYQILIILDGSRRMFKKSSNAKFNLNPSRWERSCSMLTDGQTYVTKTIFSFAFSRTHNHCYCRKAVTVVYSERVFVALGIQHTVRMHRIILYSVACLALPYSSTSHKRYDFRKNVLKKKCLY